MRIHSSALQYFDAVRRAGSIREAARRLNVASSAVNRQVLKLEAEIGTPLFDRTPSGVTLTTAGEILAHHVIVVLQDLDRTSAEIEALKGARVGHVEIAAVESVCSSLLPVVLGRLRERAPRVTAEVKMMGSGSIPEALETGMADVGFAFDLPRYPDLRQVYVASFKLGAIMASDHPLAGREKLSFAACSDYPLVMAARDLSINQLLAPVMRQANRQVDPVMRTNSIELMHQLVRTGEAIAFQTPIGLETMIESGALVHVPLNGPVLSDLGVYVRAGRSLPAPVDLFLQLLTAELQERQRNEQSDL
ncbi:LysR family transcriptional regulator [Breoghania sp.]|uniref:LysR family transcriptional regulator n=1 Tax=Breoghania sp. TaxID=2065378 RepID=UPI0029CA4293|nr:LysR family transcriptional regulator [Breoghania sp.]